MSERIGHQFFLVSFTNHFILVKVKINMESFKGTLDVRQEYGEGLDFYSYTIPLPQMSSPNPITEFKKYSCLIPS